MPRMPLEWIDFEVLPTNQIHILFHKPQEETIREQAIKFLGGKCVRCGYDENLMGLDIDHIFCDGSIERKKFPDYKKNRMICIAFEDNIVEAIEIIRCRYQVLCGIHHNIKTRSIHENDPDVQIWIQASNIGTIEQVQKLYNLTIYARQMKRYHP